MKYTENGKIYAKIRIVLETANELNFKDIINLRINDNFLSFVCDDKFYHFNIDKVLYYILDYN